MRQQPTTESWVIYESTLRGQPAHLQFVCEQSEWEAFELAQPGARTLIHTGIKNEGEAERLARQPRPAPTSPPQQ